MRTASAGPGRDGPATPRRRLHFPPRARLGEPLPARSYRPPANRPRRAARRLDEGERSGARRSGPPNAWPRAGSPSGGRWTPRAAGLRAVPPAVARVIAPRLSRPVAVVCNHGNSSKKATAFLRERGVAACFRWSAHGGVGNGVLAARVVRPRPHSSTWCSSIASAKARCPRPVE